MTSDPLMSAWVGTAPTGLDIGHAARAPSSAYRLGRGQIEAGRGLGGRDPQAGPPALREGPRRHRLRGLNPPRSRRVPIYGRRFPPVPPPALPTFHLPSPCLRRPPGPCKPLLLREEAPGDCRGPGVEHLVEAVTQSRSRPVVVLSTSVSMAPLGCLANARGPSGPWAGPDRHLGPARFRLCPCGLAPSWFRVVPVLESRPVHTPPVGAGTRARPVGRAARTYLRCLWAAPRAGDWRLYHADACPGTSSHLVPCTNGAGRAHGDPCRRTAASRPARPPDRLLWGSSGPVGAPAPAPGRNESRARPPALGGRSALARTSRHKIHPPSIAPSSPCRYRCHPGVTVEVGPPTGPPSNPPPEGPQRQIEPSATHLGSIPCCYFWHY